MAEAHVQPVIPDKKYFTIGEVSDLCQVKPHVLRYWEQEFPQLRPAKRRGNRRYYKREDISLIRQIRQLLYFQGYTINGARAVLTKQTLLINEPPVAAAVVAVAAETEIRTLSKQQPDIIDNDEDQTKSVLTDMLQELEKLYGQLTKAEV